MSAILLHITGLLCGILVPYTSAQLPWELYNYDPCGSWARNNVTQACYNFNLESVRTWEEANGYCQAIGSFLLTITSQAEQDYISERLMNKSGTTIWLGLNQNERTLEWQWSNKEFLTFWNMDSTSLDIGRRECGMYRAGEPEWKRADCDIKLQYVCKRTLRPEHHKFYENWKYYPTRCESDWIPYNRRCCKLRKEEFSWAEASAACRNDGAELMSVNSLADVEFLLNLLDHENVTEAWIGLSSQRNPVEFKWSDGSEVTFANWETHEPIISLKGSDLCVSAQGSDGNWKVRPCNRTLFSVCKKPGRYGTVNDGQCPENWVRHGDYCYGSNRQHKTFQAMIHDSSCPLATITNRFEQAFINSMIYSEILPKSPYFWIALQDINITGEYSWLVNSKENRGVSFTNWDTREPSYKAGCVILRGGFNAGRWKVQNCRELLSYSLCKKPLIADEERESNPQEGDMDQACAESWDTEPHLHYCYKVFHHEKLIRARTWQEAEDMCQEFGAHLVSLSNKEEERFVEELLSTTFNGDGNRKFWIGLSKQDSPSWEWSDGSPVVSPFWHDTNPNDVSSNCVAYRADTQLELLNCTAQAEWVCKIPKGVIPKTPDWYITEFPWVFYHGKHYYFFDKNYDIAEAQLICSVITGEVTSILTEAEQEFIHNEIKQKSIKKQKWWIGLVNNYDGFLRWMDGSFVTYTNWKTDPQGNINSSLTVGEKQCVYMESDTGLWSISDCVSKNPTICKLYVIFKIEKDNSTEDIDHYDESSICPWRWLYYANKCFFIFKDDYEMMDWYSASNHCRKYGGGLATIANKIEQAFILIQLFGEEKSFWIGVSKNDLWENGKTYNNWTPTRYTDSGVNDPDQLCPMISANHSVHPIGTWYLDKCSPKEYGFICEKDKEKNDPAVNSTDMLPISETMEYGHKKYRIIFGNMSWYEAFNACRDYGEKLISITDQFHQAFVTILVHRLGYPHWIGFFSPDSRGNFRWMDGAKTLITSWANKEAPLTESCVYIDTNGYWRAEDCDTELQGALCLPSTGTGYNDTGYNDILYNDTGYSDLSDKCPDEWILFDHFCYSINTTLYNEQFYKAEEFCKEQGGEVLKILTKKEQSFLHFVVKTFISVPSIWLSKVTSLGEGKVAWSDGTLVNYSKWNEEVIYIIGLVDNYCVSMWMDDGTWKIDKCNKTRGFVCKKGERISPIDTGIHTATNHFIMPIIVVTTAVTSILLIFTWHLLKDKRWFSRSFNIQRLQSTQCSLETNNADLYNPIADLDNSENL